MKKKVISVLLVAAMTVTMLAGCASTSSDSAATTEVANDSTEATEEVASSESEEAVAEPVSISFYTTETGKDDMYKEAISDFEQKNPGITVEYIAAGDDQLQKWMSLYASNEGPTVSFMDPINIYENQERMRVFDKTESPWLDNVQETAFSTFTYDDKIYGVPGSAAGIGLIYNKRVCDEAVGGDFDPSTIKSRSDLKELFDQIEATGVSATMFTGVNWSLGAHYLGMVYGAYRGEVAERVAYVASQRSGETQLIDDDVFNGFMDTFDMMAEYNYNEADPLIGNVNLDGEALATGQVGTWFMGDWAWTYIGPIEDRDSEFGIMSIPVSDDEDDYLNTIIPTSYAKGYCVDASQNTEEQQQAGLKFIEYLTSDESCQQLFADICGQAFPYKNFTATIESPLGTATSEYIAEGRTYDFYGTADLLPSDFWYENGAFMCEYLAGGSDRETLSENIKNYWTNHE